LIKEDYNFKLLKHILLNSSMGHIKLYRVGLTYRLINYIINYLKDFRIDWRYYNIIIEALLNILISNYFI